MFSDCSASSDKEGMGMDRDSGPLGLPSSLYSILNRLSTEIATIDGKLLDDEELVQSSVDTAIAEMKKLDLRSQANDTATLSNLPQNIEIGEAVKSSENLTRTEFVELLRKIPDQDWRVGVLVKMKEGCFNLESEDYGNKLNFLLSLETVKEVDVVRIHLYHLNEDSNLKGITLHGSPPWERRSLVYEFLSDSYPKVFPSLATKEMLLKALDEKFEQSTRTFKQVYDSMSPVSSIYIENFVESFPSVNDIATFDLSKSKVVVIGGESGSGKTIFATRTIRDKIRINNEATAFLYHSLDDSKDCVSETPASAIKLSLGLVLQKMAARDEKTLVYRYLSDANMEINENRNRHALCKLNKILKEATLSENEITRRWWNEGGTPPDLTLNGLVIIIDEVGKDLMFAYGVVEMGRTIVAEICRLRRALNCLLVFVGAGCDAFGSEDPSMNTFGTDPTKCVVVVMGKTNLETLQTNGIILEKEVYGGLISRVLADNARMLMHGVVPLLTSNFLTVHYNYVGNGDELRTMHRIKTGSYVAPMHYCYRNYILLNGLGRLNCVQVDKTMKDLFQFLVQKELNTLVKSPWFLAVKDINPLLSRTSDDRKLFSLGLATQTQSSSSAMKFLACDGQALPVLEGDGIAFEELVMLHLTRLFCLSDDEKTINYTLRCAWPPPATAASYEECVSNEFLGHVVSSQAHLAEVKNLCNDIIAKRYEVAPGEGDGGTQSPRIVHAVLRQSVKNAQGPDIIVLHVEKAHGYLDLFQVKNRKNLPTRTELVEWMQSLGLEIEYPSEGECNVCNVPFKCKKAMYTAICMNELVSTLQDTLGVELQISVSLRTRYLVIKQSCDEIKGERMKYYRPLIMGDGVRIWTSNFLEPTFSAIPQKIAEESD